jgi:streptogramin lyase
MKDVQGIARSGSSYWAATNGGLFRWREGSSEFQRLTNAEGLQSTALTAISVDPDGAVWSGSATGFIHVLQPSTGLLRIIRDIATASETNKQINAITVAGDTVLLCTDFGLSTFRRGKFEFGETYTRFASIPAGTRISVRCAVIYGGRVWAGISDGFSTRGVASAALDGRNLLVAENWTLDPLGTDSPLVLCLALANGRLYAGSANGLFDLEPGGWTEIPAFHGRAIVSMAGFADHLLLATRSFEVFSLDLSGGFRRIGPLLPFIPTSLTANAGGAPVAGSLQGGILTLDSAWTAHIPNGPNSNQFSSVTVDANGVVWGASGSSTGAGMYRFDGQTWTSFMKETSALPVNEVYRVSTACNGSVWGSMWGRGVAEFPGGGTTLDSSHVYHYNVGMVGVADNDLGGAPKYIVTSNVVCDGHSNTWFSILGALNKNLLAVRKPDNTWRFVPVIYNGTKITNLVESAVDRVLAVDGQDNLWAVVRDPAYAGVVCLQNQGVVDSTARVLITSANGLPSDNVQTIVVDRDNAVWVGTDRGIGIILDPANPLRNGAIAAYKPLLGITVNTIAVDPLNQKWVGTPEGVVVLTPDGTQQLASYTVDNTNGQLIEDNIRSIAVAPKSGTVYFGTASGLASLTTSAAAPVETPGGLRLYPNPYRIPAASPLTIDGLLQDSQIKVLTASGSLVRDLKTPGGRIGFWDGKDDHGADVASGIYFIVGYTEDGSIVKGKVAVLRK